MADVSTTQELADILSNHYDDDTEKNRRIIELMDRKVALSEYECAFCGHANTHSEE